MTTRILGCPLDDAAIGTLPDWPDTFRPEIDIWLDNKGHLMLRAREHNKSLAFSITEAGDSAPDHFQLLKRALWHAVAYNMPWPVFKAPMALRNWNLAMAEEGQPQVPPNLSVVPQ